MYIKLFVLFDYLVTVFIQCRYWALLRYLDQTNDPYCAEYNEPKNPLWFDELDHIRTTSEKITRAH